MEFPRTGIRMVFLQKFNIKGCANEIYYNTELEPLDKIKENLNIT